MTEKKSLVLRLALFMIGIMGLLACEWDGLERRDETVFVDHAERRRRNSYFDKLLGLFNPNAFFEHVWKEASVGLSGDFKTDPFLFLSNTTNGIRFSGCWASAGNLAFSSHEFTLV